MKSRATTSGFLVICFVFCGAAWGQQEPAGEGRPITPAGALVIDASTHLPAVGAMPMAILRTGYFRTRWQGPLSASRQQRVWSAVQAATNEAQQSIAVIDLNATPEPV